uniref:Anaphase-promoting complex subunit 4 WD40 domain-containing protein n=1 Tax=Pinguiococcus pyrenoidosus TaxID=172671 RepID=A0A7R9UG09_9STRA
MRPFLLVLPLLSVSGLRMRRREIVRMDASMVTSFQAGQRVRVRPSFRKLCPDPEPEGVIVDTWVKCEVDPHCCCAELAFDAPIGIRFESGRVVHFAEEEIQLVRQVRRDAHAGPVLAIAPYGATEDGEELLVSAGGYGQSSTMMSWEMSTLERRRKLWTATDTSHLAAGTASPAPASTLFSLDFFPEAQGGVLAWGGSDGWCFFARRDSRGNLQGKVDGPPDAIHRHSGWVRDVRFAPDGQRAYAIGCESLAVHRLDGLAGEVDYIVGGRADGGMLDSGRSPDDPDEWRRHDILCTSITSCERQEVEEGAQGREEQQVDLTGVDLIGAGLVDGSVRCHLFAPDSSAAKLIMNHGWKAHSERVVGLAWFGDVESAEKRGGKKLVSLSKEGSLKVWEVAIHGTEERLFAERLHAEASLGVECRALATSPASIFVGCADGTVRGFDPSTLEEVLIWKGDPGDAVTALSISPSAKLLIGTKSGTIAVVSGGA